MALEKAAAEAYEFAMEPPTYFSILTLGVLAILTPWIIEILGFGELGLIEGSFIAAWQF
ncbi:hypothetical protein P152DRAFT_471195 [Eremomyces bilateralis CBS 781.70]|uniref:Uncharacterized protein n=1 Tax=Eremomyces bilateralis CBS 781.70 TaxID=1392243 RepID=A0A6G1GCJ6_9PEZI|nr:uncharacterized protein P152DRAFT_471195 [Eremomyces bilateralis CBS 781.70]KAF1815807.1 hypothetical protein P152DRAFT_471195 [Eremomyces bilateralis CBS 781.70]